jgi:hypothetical protein
MAQRVRIPHRGQCPSSARQLPILAALHARSPTLFAVIIHELGANVNIFLALFWNLAPNSGNRGLIQKYFVENDEKSSK